MYELWARRITTKKYEFIIAFEDEHQKFYFMDQLDTDIYYEAMILEDRNLKMYREFGKKLSKVLRKK